MDRYILVGEKMPSAIGGKIMLERFYNSPK